MILEEKNNKEIVAPQGGPVIRLKVLRLMAQEIAKLDLGPNPLAFFTDCGVNSKKKFYPKKIGRMVYRILLKLATSNKPEDKKVLFKIIEEAIHPLTHNGDELSAEALRNKFNSYLKYDNLAINFNGKDNAYVVDFEPTEIEKHLEQTKTDEWYNRMLEDEKREQLIFLRDPERTEKVSLLRESYKLLMSVIRIFCENPAHPTSELNNAYKFLDKLVEDTLQDVEYGRGRASNFNNYTPPFVNLFFAEKQYREEKKELSWQKIRPEMNAMYGDIEDLCREVGANDIIAEPDMRGKLNEIELYLLKLQEEINKDKEKKQDKIRETSGEKLGGSGKEKMAQNFTPHCYSKNGVGYLKFGGSDEEIKIGRETIQPFILVRSLTNPFGSPKSVDELFYILKETLRSKTTNTYIPIDKSQKVEIIKNVIKAAQKRLEGRFKFDWDSLETKLKLRFH